jgi:peptidoglycan-associated lipoprotein
MMSMMSMMRMLRMVSMTRQSRLACTSLAVALAAACHPAVVPAPPRADVIVLLPDPEEGHLGSATVATSAGRVELRQAREATRVISGQAPGTPALISDDEIKRRFGDAMAARPLAPRQFLLYFETGGDSLTAESQALLPQIVDFVRNRPAPDVTVIGHTDTTGDEASNYDLGLRRATLIRDLLLRDGLDPDQVDVASHGEADLLVPTPDNSPEPRNRRVEVTVR